jgi:hypothetical protein
MSRGRTDVHGHAQPIQRTIDVGLERRLQVEAGERGHDSSDLGKRHLVRRDTKLERGIGEVLLDGAVHGQRRLLGSERHLRQVHRIVSHRDHAGKRVQPDLRLRPAKRHVRDSDRVVHRLVLEAE